MTAPRRLRKELTDLQQCQLKSFREISTDDDNLLRWTGLIVPENAPYNKGAFRIEINFPAEYPFKPPKINFKTKIYHPNIDEKGQVCLPIISTENWKPATRTDQVYIFSLILLDLLFVYQKLCRSIQKCNIFSLFVLYLALKPLNNKSQSMVICLTYQFL